MFKVVSIDSLLKLLIYQSEHIEYEMSKSTSITHDMQLIIRRTRYYNQTSINRMTKRKKLCELLKLEFSIIIYELFFSRGTQNCLLCVLL